MAKKKSGKGAWIAGSILGAIAGAAYALWKTPMSGEELRSKLVPGPVSGSASVAQKQPGTRFSDKVIGMVENAAAPIVGVELGKTANGTGTAVESAPIVPDESLVAPVTAPETVVAAPAAPGATTTGTTTTTSYGTDTIRAKRFGWGEPKPEVTIPAESPVVVNEHVEETETLAHVEPVEQDQPAASTFGNTSIRAQRFGWGEPAPAAPAVNDGAAIAVEEASAVEAVQTSVTPEAAQLETLLKPVETTTVDTSSAKMHPWPKLGGLE